ncbi:MAG: hypothetical protein LBS21_11215 [Clostridiales bacterium]|jgi:rhodanese-related sulfurtransferase|nr:hypothetical protein [Clostridiales bacterium]
MNKKFITTAVFLLIGPSLALYFIYLGSAAKPEPSAVSSMESYRSVYVPGHVSSGEAKALFDEKPDTLVVDLRSKESYNELHVAGSLNVSYEDLESFAAQNENNKSRRFIFYCFCGEKGGSALSAYEYFESLGFTDIYFTEPEDEWKYEGTAAGSGDVKTEGAAGSGDMKTEGTAGSGDVKTITGEEALDIYKSDAACVLLDVRNLEEYEAGHIEGSVLIPVSQLEERLNELPDKERAIIVYCRSGVRSKNACSILSANGYTNIYDMQRAENWPESLVQSM